MFYLNFVVVTVDDDNGTEPNRNFSLKYWTAFRNKWNTQKSRGLIFLCQIQQQIGDEGFPAWASVDGKIMAYRSAERNVA